VFLFSVITLKHRRTHKADKTTKNVITDSKLRVN